MGVSNILMDCTSFVTAIGNVGISAQEASHAIGEMSKAMGNCSHAEGYGSLPVRQSTNVTAASVILFSIVRKPVLKVDKIKGATLTIDSEKIDWDVLERNFGPFNNGDVIFYK